MTKRLMFSGAVAAFVVTALVMVNAQGRMGQRGPEARWGSGQGQGPVRGVLPGRRGPLGEFGRAGFGRGGRMGAGRLGEFARLDLTADQRDKLSAVLSSERGAGRDAVDELGAAHRALHDAIFAVTPDANAIAAAQSKVAAAEAAALAERVKTEQAVAAILTPEQKAKLAEGGGRGGRMAPGPGRGFGRGSGRR